jgi:hypothetical protein
MTAIAEDLLRVWEDNQRAHPVRRALLALAAAAPAAGWEGWAQAPIGTRDRALLRLHERLFGGELQATANCPGCGERLETAFSVEDIRGPLQPDEAAPPAPASPMHLQEQGFDIEYRLPTSEDLLQLAAQRGDPATAGVRLLRRCVNHARRGDAAIDPGALPEALIDRIADDIAARDPDADVRIGLSCPACGTAWQLPFDAVSYFWSELDDWAQRTLADIHALALAYGWSERDILALSPARRQIYLDMVNA